MVSVLQPRISIAESTVLHQMDKNHKFNSRFALYPVCSRERKAAYFVES